MSPKDKCNLKSLKNSRETILLLIIIIYMKKLCSHVHKSHLEIKKIKKILKNRKFFVFNFLEYFEKIALLLANQN